MSDFDFLLNKHRQLDYAVRNNKGQAFLSGWNSVHPFQKEYSKIDANSSDKLKYQFYKDSSELKELIVQFHQETDRIDLNINSVLPGDGSTPLIAAFCSLLFSEKIKEVFYIPPMYYMFYHHLKFFGIKTRPVSRKHLFEESAQLNLPDKKTILIFSDPIWYAGKSVNQSFIDEIAKWQRKTESIVFVDGTFQYIQWNGSYEEKSSQLSQELTYRLICPTKYLAVHGHRFSYCLVPADKYEPFLYSYDNLIGPTSTYNLSFAHSALRIMLRPNRNKELIDHIMKTYLQITEVGAIKTTIIPDSSFFVFGQINSSLKNLLLMDQGYFDQKRFPDYYRVNLLGGDTLKIINGASKSY